MPSGVASAWRQVGAAGPDPQRRRAALDAARQRYGGLSVAGKRRLLDELEGITGYHRKSLLRLLNRRPPSASDWAQVMEEMGEPKPHPRRRYGPEAAAALLPLLVESLEQHGHLTLELAVRDQVLAMSSATIDRLLAPIRKASGGNNWRRPPRAYSGVRRQVPVRTFKGWDDHHEPGWLEIELVAHCGGWMQGPFLWTLMATESATGWSESVPILVRDGAVVLTAP